MFRRGFLASLAGLFGLGAVTASASPLGQQCGAISSAPRSRFLRFENGGAFEGPGTIFIDLSEVAVFRSRKGDDGWRLWVELKSGQALTVADTKERIDRAISLLLAQ